MKEAAYSDQDFNRKQQPAIAKVKLLPAVIEHLAKKQYFDQYLDNNILDGMKLVRLEPLPGRRVLPNLDVQSAMLTTLGKMPIRTEHLRESKIGRVVMFYSKCDRVLPGIQKIVKELLEKWMRPILGRSNNYKEKPIASANVDQRPARPGVPADSRNSAPEDTATRARVPQSVRAAFDIVPKSDLTWNKNDKSKPAANQYKKFKSRMQNLKKRSD
ncbi:hypothetical protein BC829DRAFT_456573 [Chytridium lagenaria]|nr:hypothetical protein BC829DRAFT_456573 [Chytridium lagenaria]